MERSLGAVHQKVITLKEKLLLHKIFFWRKEKMELCPFGLALISFRWPPLLDKLFIADQRAVPKAVSTAIDIH